MTRPVEQTEPGKPSIVRDGQSRIWRLCLKCNEYRLLEDSPLTCSTCDVEYGKAEREPVTEQLEMAQATHRATLCEKCGKGFAVLATNWNPAAAEFCDPCKAKEREKELLTAQLLSARPFGHTEPGSECELCSVESALEALKGSDWRDERDKAHERLERRGRPLPWTPAGH